MLTCEAVARPQVVIVYITGLTRLRGNMFPTTRRG